MGLDASVYCNCVETGRLLKPHPFPELSQSALDGSPEINSDDNAKRDIFYDWYDSQPCAHENFEFVSLRLGNITLISYLRSAIDEIALAHDANFPVLRKKVIYSGIHSGDYLNREEVEILATEITHLRALFTDYLTTRATLKTFDERMIRVRRAQYLAQFLVQIDELIVASRQVGKPISF